MTRSRREIEALADILLGEVPDGTQADSAQSDRVVLLVEAHLPVRGVLWRLAAAGLAAGEAPATLLELDDRQIHATHMEPGGAEGKVTTLEHVIAAPSAGHTWLVAANGPSPWAGVCQLADEVVLLTGADQAAVVGAYRAAKQIVTEVGKADLRLGIVIAGSPQRVAEEVWGRLAETIETNLGVRATLVGVLPQLDVAGTHARVTVPAAGSRLGVLIDSIRARGLTDPVRKLATATPDRPALAAIADPSQAALQHAPTMPDTHQQAMPDTHQHAPGVDTHQQAAASGVDTHQQAAGAGLDTHQQAAASGVDTHQQAAGAGLDTHQHAAAEAAAGASVDTHQHAAAEAAAGASVDTHQHAAAETAAGAGVDTHRSGLPGEEPRRSQPARAADLVDIHHSIGAAAPPAPTMPDSAAAGPSDTPIPPTLHLLRVDAPVPRGVSLATDEAGGLHLIASESAAATLEAAHRWATAHLSLLAAASPLIDASKPVTRDLMVDNIHRAAGLAGGAWQVHLVQGDACYPVPDPEV